MKQRYEEIEGNLITLAQNGHFDVIVHGCNCFCTMGAGLAPQMAEAFQCDKFPMEARSLRGDINKLGQIDYLPVWTKANKHVMVVNAYTQYNFGRNRATGNHSQPVDYEAITLVMRKLNKVFKHKTIGLPQIGAGLAGGDWKRIKAIIQQELVDCYVSVVIFKP